MSPLRILALTLGLAGCARPGLTTPITSKGGGPVAAPMSEPPPVASTPRTLDVHATLLRSTLTTCNYRAVITGTLRVTSADANSTNPDTATYEPDLTVSSEVLCEDTQSARQETRVLRGLRLTRNQMLDALHERGSVAVNRGDHVCTVRPGFSFDGEAIYGYQVTDTCGAAVGGGPRDVEMTAQSSHYPQTSPPARPGFHHRFPHAAGLSAPRPFPGHRLPAEPHGPRLAP